MNLTKKEWMIGIGSAFTGGAIVGTAVLIRNHYKKKEKELYIVEEDDDEGEPTGTTRLVRGGAKLSV